MTSQRNDVRLTLALAWRRSPVFVGVSAVVCNATVALFVLCLAPNDAAAQKGAKSTPHPVETGRPRSGTSTEINPPSGAREGSGREHDSDSTFATKALTGRVELQVDQLNAQRIGETIWNDDLYEIRSRTGRPFSADSYRAVHKELFRKTWNASLETSVAKEAGKLGYIIFTGGWQSEGSLVSFMNPAFDRYGYAYINEGQVARGTLYLPYFSALDAPIQLDGRAKTAKTPLVAIDEQLFFDEKDGTVHLRELLLDPTADLRGYRFTDTKPIQLRPLESRQLEFEPGRAESATITKLLGCCVYVRPPAFDSGELVKFLKAIRFDVSRLRVALMVHDSATRSYLAGDLLLSSQGRAEAINRDTKDIEPWVVSQLKKASGGTLLLLGHVEGGDYVVRDSSGEEAGRIPVQRANELALQHKVTMFNLGCKTADTLRDHDGIGVYDAFNSIHMLRTISAALHSGPKTIADFLERLGTPEARIVIPARIMDKANSVVAANGLRDPAGRRGVEGNRPTIPAIQPIVSPSGMTKGLPTSMSVFLTSARQNDRGFFPVVAEVHVVMDACQVLAAARKVKWYDRGNLTCVQFRDAPYKPVLTHLYGDAERKFR